MKLQLKVSDLKQYVYCPRIVFYQYVMPVGKATTFKMEHGKTAEDTIDRLEKRRGLKRYGIDGGKREFHKWIASERLALSGKLDLLISASSGYYPVDFKYTEGGPYKNHIYQLCGYALILEDIYSCRVNKGFVYLIPREDAVEFEITDLLKTDAKSLLDVIREIISSEKMPQPTPARNKCIDCEYRNYCGDVF